MTHTEAVEKANAEKGPAIDIMWAEAGMRLVGKTLVAKTNRMKVEKIVNGNYVVRVNDDNNNYHVISVAWALQEQNRRFTVE
jgi:hypothetical protein